MKLDPRQLEILLAVARSGSLTAAAQQLNMSQPGVSSAIAQLERSVGVQLLERGRHGARATDSGKLLLRRAEAIEQMIHQAHEEVRLATIGIGGPVIVAGTPGALVSVIPKALETMRNTFGRFELHVVEVAQESRLVDMLRERSANLTVSTVGLEHPPADIVEIVAASDPFQLVVGKNHLLDQEVVSLHDVFDLPWVMPAAMGAFRRHIDTLFMAESLPLPRDIVLCDSLGTTKAIVERGHHITILPQSVVATAVRSSLLRTIQLSQPQVQRSIGVRHLGNEYLPPAVEAFVRVMAKETD